MDLNNNNLNTLFTGFKAAFNKGFEGAPSAYKNVAMTVPSSTAEEEYGWLGTFPKMREWLGDRVVHGLKAHGYKIKNKNFEETISVSRNNIEDDQYGIFGPMFSELGKAAAELPDELIFGLLAAGFATACYDGQYFFDTDHPVLDAGGNETVSVSNSGGGAGTAWYLIDTSRAIRPFVFQERRALGTLVSLDQDQNSNVFWRNEYVYGTDGRCNAGYGLWQLAYASKQDLTADNYEAARQAMMSMKGDYGRKLGIKPTTLVVPSSLEGAAMRLLNNGTRVQTVDDGTGTLRPVGVQNEWANSAELIVTSWLD